MCSLYFLSFFLQLQVHSPSEPTQNIPADSKSQASFTLSNYSTGQAGHQQQQASGSLPAASLLINLFSIAFSTARKPPLIIDRNAEATRGNLSQRTEVVLIILQLLSKWTQRWAMQIAGCQAQEVRGKGPGRQVWGWNECSVKRARFEEWVFVYLFVCLFAPSCHSGKLNIKVARDRTYRWGSTLIDFWPLHQRRGRVRWGQWRVYIQ